MKMSFDLDIPSKDLKGSSWKAFCGILLEEWREEIFPERDGLHGETEGDNERHLIVRAEFLDRLLETLRSRLRSKTGFSELL